MKRSVDWEETRKNLSGAKLESEKKLQSALASIEAMKKTKEDDDKEHTKTVHSLDTYKVELATVKERCRMIEERYNKIIESGTVTTGSKVFNSIFCDFLLITICRVDQFWTSPRSSRHLLHHHSHQSNLLPLRLLPSKLLLPRPPQLRLPPPVWVLLLSESESTPPPPLILLCVVYVCVFICFRVGFGLLTKLCF